MQREAHACEGAIPSASHVGCDRRRQGTYCRMDKTKYSKLATHDEQEPLPVRASGRTVVEEVLRVASTDPPVAKAFRAPRRTVWTTAQERLSQGPPSWRIDVQTRPWFLCVAEWAIWLGQVALPLLWAFALFILSGLLITLDCSNVGSRGSLNCQEGFVLNFAFWGTTVVAAVAAGVFAWSKLCRSKTPPIVASSSSSASYGNMRVATNP
eukprot:COSAG02_NODE_154_length_33067_cov_38.282092_4_plen_210_part_00